MIFACGILPGEQKRVTNGMRRNEIKKANASGNTPSSKQKIPQKRCCRRICHSGFGIEKQASVCANLGVVLRIGKIRVERVCDLHRAWSRYKREAECKYGVGLKES